MENFNDTFLARWIAGEASAEEINAFKKNPNYEEYLKIKAASDSLSFSEFNEEKAFQNLKATLNTSKKSKVIPIYTWIASAAACAILFFGFVFFNNAKTTYTSTIASTSSVQLPDNSVMVLNASAQAKVNTKTWEENRSVFLEGEAFFKVAKGATFTVNTDLGTVQVLGTQFTVNTINENVFIVKCFEGKVQVDYNENTHILTKGKAMQFVNGVKKVWNFSEESPSWLAANETELREMPLEQVIVSLERQYDVKIKNLKALHLDTLFTGSFTNKNIEQALYAVFGTLGVNYELVNDKEVRLLSK